MFWFGDYTIILLLPVLALAFYAQYLVKSNYNKFKNYNNGSGLSGAEIARLILQKNGLHHIAVKPVEGTLSDHYDPRSKVVHLSEDIYYGHSVSAASIAAHEVGHALQHASKYVPLSLRSGIFPVANFGSKAALPLFLAGFIFQTGFLMDLGIWLFFGALLFHLVTLPVELNASRRAIKQLRNGQLVESGIELVGSKKVLRAAALTYVASTLMALVQFLRLIILRGARE
jgi:hypothetical protein